MLSDEQIKVARKEWEQVMVVVRSLGRRVPADRIAKDVAAWEGLGYDLEVFLLADDHLALRFKSAGDCDKVLAGGPWVVVGQLIAMEAWRLSFIPDPGMISAVIVWLRLSKLPMEFWGSEVVLQIVAMAGRPLLVDEVTGQWRRMGFAWVKVVIDASKPLVPGVLIKGEEEDFWQAFVYESLSKLCYGCGRIGHGQVRCLDKSLPELCCDCGCIGHGQVRCPFLWPKPSTKAGEREVRVCPRISAAVGGLSGCPESRVRPLGVGKAKVGAELGFKHSGPGMSTLMLCVAPMQQGSSVSSPEAGG